MSRTREGAHPLPKFVLTLTCPDRPGIVRALSGTAIARPVRAAQQAIAADVEFDLAQVRALAEDFASLTKLFRGAARGR